MAESNATIEYRSREIKFRKLVKIEDWSVKLYTISKNTELESHLDLDPVIAQLPEWLALKNSFDATHEHIAFLIIHSGTEGVFSILNWWVGKNMLNTHIFFSDPNHPEKFQLISGDGLAPCIWELEVINHERNSWIANVLKKPDIPDYEQYLNDDFNGIL